MDSTTKGSAPTRRAVLAGTAGIGILALRPAAAQAGTEPRRLSVHGLTVVHGNLVAPARGERALVAGGLVDDHGDHAGTFHADVAVVATASRHAHEPVGALETHTLSLTEGTIIGSGTADHLGAGTFAVIGGTGAFTGARGSYLLTQSRVGQGGDGSGTLVLSLV